jgi:hypothetical protein
MSNIDHPEFGHVCMCDCHKEGSQIMHVMECCHFCYKEYLKADGTLIEEVYRQLCKDRGIKLPFRPVFDVKPFEKLSMPKVSRAFSELKADEIVAANPMSKDEDYEGAVEFDAPQASDEP